MSELNALEGLVNIGPALAEKLRAIGVRSWEDLASIGSVEAMMRVADGEPVVHFNMLYALEGALRGVRWHQIPSADRRGLKGALKERERELGIVVE